MSDVATADGVKLYYEERGTGVPVVFVHEFGGSCRSFDLQVEAFQGRHHCVVFNARGYPPSDVPASVDDYSQDIAAGDIAAVMDRLGIVKAHLVGVSMGAASALQFALRSRSRALSVTLVGIGSGSDEPEQFRVTAEANAKLIEAKGMAVFAEQMGGNPNRVRLKEKNPAEHRRFIERLSAMSSAGAANTMRGVQQRRPPIYAHKKGLASLRVPALVVVGEEDAGCRKPSEFIERTLPEARLVVVPGTGHVVNQEEPTEFNRLCLAFIDGVDARGR
ncbi:MAG TPA: alpha/beta hydrolase [Burkholderiales bacterium]|nr:alpha/beta hydrolase [Burkholderiales bacterium]